jgi:protein TonB
LEWYLKARGRQSMPAAAAPAPAPQKGNSELLGYDQMTTSPSASHASLGEPHQQKHERQKSDQKKEAELFAYMEGGASDADESARSRFRLGRGAIAAALVLAAGAIAAAPQAPWHPKMRVLWAHGQKSLHTWLNPQPVTPAQAPVAHESFARAGDEYKLPAAENIPDATTDPSQIRVVPVIDPTAKKPNNDGANPDQNQTAAPADPSSAPPDGSAQAPAVQVTEAQPSAPASTPPQPSTSSPVTVSPAASATSNPPAQQVDTPVVHQPVASNPVPVKSSQPRYVPTVGIPLSLKSQMAAPTADPGGTKPPENALPSIEPVAVQESVERALLSDQPALVYPANAKGTATVVLEVLIGRDGTVQEAKFLQGSLAFARNAIDGVRQWKFKPYSMNGRPVAVQTNLTVTFKPGS